MLLPLVNLSVNLSDRSFVQSERIHDNKCIFIIHLKQGQHDQTKCHCYLVYVYKDATTKDDV
jgi:hypothetical protein